MQWDATGYDARFSFVTSYGDAVLDLLDAWPGERILDLGAGTGHQLAALAEAAGSPAGLVGVDPDPAMLAVARETYPDLTFRQADGQELDAADLDGPYDAVLSNAAMHWMPRQDAVVAGVARLLRPGGRFVVEMGGVGNVARLREAIGSARAELGLPPVPHPWTFPTPGEQAARLERHGFVVRLVALIDRPTPLNEGDTAASWVAMFGASMVVDVPVDRRADLHAAVDASAARLGLAERPDGEPGWWVDYVRLRFLAELRA